MKKRNRLLIRLLTAVLCISLLPVTVMAASDEGDPEQTGFTAWAAGTEGDTYPIWSVEYNSPITLTVEVPPEYKDSVTYEWCRAGLSDANLSLIEGETGSSITTEAITENTAYACFITAEGIDEPAEVYYQLNVYNDLQVYIQGTWNKWERVLVERGDPAELAVSVSALYESGITYYWYCGDDLIDGATGASLTTGAITAPASYRCSVVDRFGNEDGAYFDVGPQNHLKAWVTGDEEYCTETEMFVDKNTSVTLSVSAEADDESGITYNWRLRDEYYNHNDIDGATNSTYTVQMGTEPLYYSCEVRDSISGDSKYIFFDLYVNNHLKATIAGTDSSYEQYRVAIGETRTLSVAATADDDEGLSYVWTCDGNMLDETSGTLVTPPIIEDLCYECRVTDKYNNEESVVFDISAVSEIDAWPSGKELWGNSEYRTVGPNGYLTLAVDSDWPGTLTYKWYKQSIESYMPDYQIKWSDPEIISGAAGDSVVIGPISETCRIFCELESESGLTSIVWFNIYVNNGFHAYGFTDDDPDAFTYMSLNAQAGESLLMRADCDANDADGIEYTWYRTGASGIPEMITGTATAYGSTYTVNDMQKSETYYCVVKDKYNNYLEVTFDIEVNADFHAWATASGEAEYTDWYFLYGSIEFPVLSVSTDAADPSDVTYTWYCSEEYDGEKTVLPDSSNSPTYTVDCTEDLKVYDYYWCKAVDSFDNVSWVSFVQVNHLVVWPTLSKNVEADFQYITVPMGGSATLEVSMDAVFKEDYGYLWVLDSEDGGDVLEETSNKLTIDNVLEDGWYQCQVYRKSDDFIEMTIEFEVECVGAWITGSDEHDTYCSMLLEKGDPVSLSVTVDDSITSPTYEWYEYVVTEQGYYDIVPIDGEYTSSFSIDSIYKGRDIECKVTDENGNEYWVEFNIFVDRTEVEPVRLLAASLTLNGYLKVKFEFDLPDEFVTGNGNYIKINDTKYFVSDAVQKNGKYYFEYSLTSSQIQKPINVRAFYGDHEEYKLHSESGIDYTSGYRFSILQYLAVVKNMPEEELAALTPKPAALKALVTRLHQFGTLAQAYFKDNNSSGSITQDELAEIRQVHADSLSAYQPEAVTKPNSGITFDISLSLQTATHLNFYFTLEEGRSIDEYEFYINGDPITLETSGAITLSEISANKYRLKVNDVAAKDLNKVYTLSVKLKSDGSEVIHIGNYSALSYAFLYLSMFESDSSRAALVDAMKSLYLYNLAADTYFG